MTSSQSATATIRSRPSALMLQVVIFRLAQERYAVPITQVQEVLPCTQVARAFEMPAGIVGILNLRGTIIPISDLRQRLGVGGQESEEQQILVLRLEHGVIGFIVDEVLQVMKISRTDIKPAPASILARAPIPVLGIATLAEQLITLIDLAASASAAPQLPETLDPSASALDSKD